MYQAMLAGVLTPLAASRNDMKYRRFGANGMSFTWERGALTPDAGLFEVASPECESPDTLLVHSLAMDELAKHALPIANHALRLRGFEGELRLVKGSRDVDGQVYGRQTNIAVAAPSGWRWAVYVVATVAFAILHLGMLYALFGATVASLLFVVAIAIGVALLMPVGEADGFGEVSDGFFRWVEMPLVALGRLYVNGASLLVFGRVAPGMQGWLISRSVITGSGYVDANGDFWLTGKGQAVDVWMLGGLWHHWGNPHRPVFATGSLLKPMLLGFPAALHPWHYFDAVRGMLAPTIRLQLGDEDSHRCPLAEGLSVAMLAHVVELAEAGHLADAPRFADPLSAHRTLSADPTLGATVTDTQGRTWTALTLQDFYARRAHEHAPEDAWVREWLDVVDTLAGDRSKWVGSLDWVTKEWLLAQIAAGAPLEVRQRVDIEYHTLGDGLYDRLMAVLDVPAIVDEVDVEQAMWEPPEGRARQRADLIAAHQDRLVDVGWDRVRLPDRVVWL